MPQLENKPDPIRRGQQSLSAEALNRMRDIPPRQVRGGSHIDVSYFGDRVVVGNSDVHPSVPDLGNYTAQFVVLEEKADYLICTPFVQPTDFPPTRWIPQYYDSELGKDSIVCICVAKPYDLQQAPWEGAVVVFRGATVSFHYTDIATRTAGVLGTQIIQPSYFPGDIIQATNGVTGLVDEDGRGVVWRDLNNAARKWSDPCCDQYARVLSTIQGPTEATYPYGYPSVLQERVFQLISGELCPVWIDMGKLVVSFIDVPAGENIITPKNPDGTVPINMAGIGVDSLLLVVGQLVLGGVITPQSEMVKVTEIIPGPPDTPVSFVATFVNSFTGPVFFYTAGVWLEFANGLPPDVEERYLCREGPIATDGSRVFVCELIDQHSWCRVLVGGEFPLGAYGYPGVQCKYNSDTQDYDDLGDTTTATGPILLGENTVTPLDMTGMAPLAVVLVLGQTGYITTPIATISGDGTGGAVVVTLDANGGLVIGAITPGSGYTFASVVFDTDPLTGATAIGTITLSSDTIGGVTLTFNGVTPVCEMVRIQSVSPLILPTSFVATFDNYYTGTVNLSTPGVWMTFPNGLWPDPAQHYDCRQEEYAPDGGRVFVDELPNVALQSDIADLQDQIDSFIVGTVTLTGSTYISVGTGPDYVITWLGDIVTVLSGTFISVTGGPNYTVNCLVTLTGSTYIDVGTGPDYEITWTGPLVTLTAGDNITVGTHPNYTVSWTGYRVNDETGTFQLILEAADLIWTEAATGSGNTRADTFNFLAAAYDQAGYVTTLSQSWSGLKASDGWELITDGGTGDQRIAAQITADYTPSGDAGCGLTGDLVTMHARGLVGDKFLFHVAGQVSMDGNLCLPAGRAFILGVKAEQYTFVDAGIGPGVVILASAGAIFTVYQGAAISPNGSFAWSGVSTTQEYLDQALDYINVLSATLDAALNRLQGMMAIP